MPKIQEYIRRFDDIEQANKSLTEKLLLQIRKDTLKISENESEDVYLYNYNSIQSSINDPIIREARGLILDKNTNIVSKSFNRFYNYNEPDAAEIDWKSARAELREDGAQVVIYNHKGRWFIQTRERANADNPLLDNNITFRAAVMGVLQQMFGLDEPFKPFEDFPSRDICYVFEFVSPDKTPGPDLALRKLYPRSPIPK